MERPGRTAGIRPAIFGLLAVALGACASTVPIAGRYPPRHGAMAGVQAISVGRFEGVGGATFAAALEARLLSVTFDGGRYFTVTDGPSAQGMLSGAVSADFDSERYEGSEQRCVEWDAKGKCAARGSFAVPCWRRTLDFRVIPSFVRNLDRTVAYASEHRVVRRTSWCRDGWRRSDQDLVAEAQDQIIAEIVKDIAPHNRWLSAGLMSAAKGLDGEAKARFQAGVRLAREGDIQAGCQEWARVQALSPDHVAVLHNLGVCVESVGDFRWAEYLYRRAAGVTGGADPTVVRSLARVRDLIEGEAALAR